VIRGITPMILVLAGLGPAPTAAQEPLAERYHEAAARLIGEAMTSDHAYDRLGRLCDGVGNRLSGSEDLDRAIAWALDEMRADGFANVHREDVMVPRWVRGHEAAWTTVPARHELSILGLGGSVGTPAGGVEGEVMVVESFDELDALGEKAVKGKIVLYDVPFTNYGVTVRFRGAGASRAAALGAVAALVRSVGPISYDTPHTGALHYDDDQPKIPAAAVTIEDATMLHRMAERGQRPVVHLEMEAHQEPDAPSANVVGEVRGTGNPEEVVVVGGHLDSWDVGQGAQDDGVGSVIAWEAARLIHDLGLKPRRTIRVVLFTNEENGLAGGKQFAKDHAEELPRVVAAMESDSGNGLASGFEIEVGPVRMQRPRDNAPDEEKAAWDAAVAALAPAREHALAVAGDIGKLLDPIGGGAMTQGGAGADVSPMCNEGVTGLGLNHDTTKYFEIHHTNADTFDKIVPENLRHNVAVMAVMTYVLADMPGRLVEDRVPREPPAGD